MEWKLEMHKVNIQQPVIACKVRERERETARKNVYRDIDNEGVHNEYVCCY
jgi:hypothetical protein